MAYFLGMSRTLEESRLARTHPADSAPMIRKSKISDAQSLFDIVVLYATWAKRLS
jgi:hypothetical protein